jgi:hypothetical protein
MPHVVKAPNLTDFQTGKSPPDAIGLRLTANDNSTYTVRIKRSQIVPLVMKIIGQAETLPPQRGRRIETNPLTPLGVDAVVAPNGHPGISIRLAGGLRLTISLTANVIADLRNKLIQAEQVLKPPPTSSSH